MLDYLGSGIINDFMWLVAKLRHDKGIEIVIIICHIPVFKKKQKNFFMCRKSRTLDGLGSRSIKVGIRWFRLNSFYFACEHMAKKKLCLHLSFASTLSHTFFFVKIRVHTFIILYL